MQSLQTIFELARSHPFYREDLRNAHRFEDAPVLEKPTLYARVETALDDPTFRRGLYLSPSGGSTGRPLFFPSDIQENQRQRELLAPRLRAAGILDETSVVLNMFPAGNMVRSLEIFDDFSEMCGATVLSLAAHAANIDVCKAAQRFGATILAGMPTRLHAFIRWLHAEKQNLSLQSVLFAGELLHPQKRLWMERVLNVQRFSGVYGSAEMGIVAYQSDVREHAVYHFPRAFVHMEIGEPDSAGFGRLVATNLLRHRHPLLRYNTGDVGRIVESNAEEVCIELRGRQSDSFSIGDCYFSLRDFASVLDQFAEFQVVVDFDERSQQDRVTFYLAGDSLQPSKSRAQLREEVCVLLEADDDLFMTEVALCQPEDLRRTLGTQKIPAVVDLRGTRGTT